MFKGYAVTPLIIPNCRSPNYLALPKPFKPSPSFKSYKTKIINVVNVRIQILAKEHNILVF